MLQAFSVARVKLLMRFARRARRVLKDAILNRFDG